MSDLPQKSIETFSTRVTNQAISVGISILLARILGAYGKGIFTYVTTTLTMLQLLSGGLSSAISWQYGRLRIPSSAVFGAMIKNLLRLSIPMAVIVAACAFVLPNQSMLISVAIAIPLASLGQAAMGFFLADGNVRFCNIQTLLSSVVFAIALIPVLGVFHLGITAVLAAWLGSFVVAAVYSALKLRSYAQGGEKPEAALVKDQLLFALRVSANSIFAFLNFRIDVFIILFILGVKPLGVYSIAIGFGELMWQLSRPLAFSAYGRVSSGSPREAADLTAKCVRHTVVMVGAGCVVLLLVGPMLIRLVYGPAFTGAGPTLRLLLPGILSYSVMPFFGQYFIQQRGKPLLTMTVSAVSAAICAAVTLLTIHKLGILSGALGTSVSYSMALAFAVAYFSAEAGKPARSLLTFNKDDIRPYTTLLQSVLKRVMPASK
jgi:O-antigen/teichoic acid export membrane protein